MYLYNTCLNKLVLLQNKKTLIIDYRKSKFCYYFKLKKKESLFSYFFKVYFDLFSVYFTRLKPVFKSIFFCFANNYKYISNLSKNKYFITEKYYGPQKNYFEN